MTAIIRNIGKVDGENAILHPVQLDEFAHFWPICAPLIDRVIDRFSEFVSVDDIGEDISKALRQLWVVVAGGSIIGAIVTQIDEYHGRKYGILTHCAGEDFRKWVRAVDLIEGYFKAEGCENFCMVGRRGWDKFLPDFRTDRIVLEKRLNG